MVDGWGLELGRVDLGFPALDRVLGFTGVDGQFGAVAGDAEAGVLDVDGDDLACVAASHAQALAGDHDIAVPGDLALRAPRILARCSAGMGEGRVFASTTSCTTWMRCPSRRRVTFLPEGSQNSVTRPELGGHAAGWYSL